MRLGGRYCITTREIALVYKLQRPRKASAKPEVKYAMPMPEHIFLPFPSFPLPSIPVRLLIHQRTSRQSPPITRNQSFVTPKL
ncbi:uncharacterized protein UV8b_08239 [Ustilaginoidea virens]|uniref:Uncharacterized protein n=1 Tax=Ustilaginoidea virens TaxID=1159556 RepID=A0A8E5HYR5_USTVR|nr:uncharacterized protein UV8b_08239 [Ustilaginoidea virens]QUC23998.1 hypothetical protein UV8b_08239 [Ustilaginoidea virens]